jgi:hypothetical protein
LGDSDVTNANDTTDKAKFRKIKPSPTAGLFGFAGATSFQPGQKDYDPKAVKMPFEPEENDKKA